MKTFRQSRSRPGFTLVELIVAMAMGLIVLTVMFTMFRTSSRSYTLQDYVAEMQQNLRVAMSSVSRDLRMAGCGINLLSQLVPTVEVYNENIGSWTNLQGITATNSTTGPDQIEMFIGDIQSGEYEATITSPMPDASSILNVDTMANFKKYDMVIISNGVNAALFQVTAEPVALNIQHNSGLSDWNAPAAFKAFPHGGGYGTGSRLYNFGSVRWVTYFIDLTDPDHPTLVVNTHEKDGIHVIADNIEDMQFHYFMADGSETDNPAGAENNVRAIRATFSARTDALDRDAATVFRPVTIEDHVIGAVAPDGYRRRLLSTIIKVRNAGT